MTDGNGICVWREARLSHGHAGRPADSAPQVLIGGLPASGRRQLRLRRPTRSIVMGSTSVLIGGKAAARVGNRRRMEAR